MLMPKRVKYRRVQRGRLKGTATRGNKITNGQFGLVATEPAMDHQQSDRSRPCRYDALYQKRWSGLDQDIPR